MAIRQPIQLVVEDELSESVLRKLIDYSGREFTIHRVLRMGGFGQIKSRVQQFKNASHATPHIVLTDLDQYACAPELLMDWGANTLPSALLFRVAIREVEAWLLADRTGIAEYLTIPLTKIPLRPEDEPDPKRTLINLARRSKKKRLAEEIVPAIGSRNSIGPLYNMRMGEFVRNVWNVPRAIENSSQLDRTLNRISSFMLE